jgi:acyl-CoA thioesterase FadM
MENLMEGYPVVIEVPVAWGEMDAFGHLNNIVYFRYFESARIAYFHKIGLIDMMTKNRAWSYSRFHILQVQNTVEISG